MSDRPKHPAIARIWRGRTTRERADEYEAYNYEVGIKPLIEKALGVQCFREDRDTETEFVTVSYWESVEAMSRFTGSDPARIHHLDRDREFLIALPDRVQILKIRASHGNAGGDNWNQRLAPSRMGRVCAGRSCQGAHAGQRRHCRACSPRGLRTGRILSASIAWRSWPSEGARIKVRNLEAIDRTPILDVKPVLDRHIER